MPKVSFDIDGTLTTPRGKEILKKKQMSGDWTIYIVTARCESRNTITYAKNLGIPRERVIFTCRKPKWEFLQKLGIDLHIENNPNVAEEIRKNTNVKVELI